MNEDLAGLEGRFVHLTTVDEVLAEFAKLTTTDEARAADVLASECALDAIVRASHESLGLTMDGSFPCTVGTGLAGETMTVPAVGWTTTKAEFDEVESVQTYRIGEQEWCLAVVRWHLGGVMLPDVRPGVAWGGCSWTTSVLFTLDEAQPRLAMLRAETPTPISNDAFEALRLQPSRPLRWREPSAT
jgi:hypothetical protein